MIILSNNKRFVVRNEITANLFLRNEVGKINIKYRTETFSGSGVRDVKEVFFYEMFELENTDILSTMLNFLAGTKCELKIALLHHKIQMGEGHEISKSFAMSVYDEMLELIKEKTGYQIKYALWLADKEDLMKTFWRWANGVYNNNDECPKPKDGDIDAYEIGPVILSESDGDGGTLYGYEQCPVPIDPKQWFASFLDGQT